MVLLNPPRNAVMSHVLKKCTIIDAQEAGSQIGTRRMGRQKLEGLLFFAKLCLFLVCGLGPLRDDERMHLVDIAVASPAHLKHGHLIEI
jgi:hypothetical protein